MIKQKILKRSQLRHRWQNTRSPQDKAKLNKAVNELKQLLNDQKQKVVQTYLGNLSATEYSLWKATKKLKRPQTPVPPL